jgi:peptidoglycan/LPS O-acetylase OafA/YrhL
VKARAVDRSEGLDVLRALAIVLVMTRHYPAGLLPAWLAPVASFGWSGVDLFFVLSGFLITRQLLAGMRMDEFYVRRALRILPAYWTVLVLYFAVPGFAERAEIAPLWKFVFFVQNFGLVAETQGAFSHAWSLCIEEHFYLVLCPLLALGYRRHETRWFLGMLGLALVGSAIVRCALWSPEMADSHSRFLTFIYYPTPTHLDGLLVGAALAALDRRGTLLKLARPAALAGAMLFIGLGAWVTRNQESLVAVVFGFPLVSIGYGWLVAAALREEATRAGTFAAALAWLAYPAYLIHKPILQMAAALTPSTSLNVAIAFVLVFAAAGALHLSIERPSLRLRKRIVESYYEKSERRAVSRLPQS